MRPCLDCGKPTTRTRCASCRAPVERARRNPIYHDPRWVRLRAFVIAMHWREHGDVCPGWRREPHPTTRFSADHIVPISSGGAPFDRTNVRVLCLSCNSARGARDD